MDLDDFVFAGFVDFSKFVCLSKFVGFSISSLSIFVIDLELINFPELFSNSRCWLVFHRLSVGEIWDSGCSLPVSCFPPIPCFPLIPCCFPPISASVSFSDTTVVVAVVTEMKKIDKCECV